MAHKASSSMSSEKDEAAEIADMTPEQRDEMASNLVDRFALVVRRRRTDPGARSSTSWRSVDFRVQMLRRLSQIYGVPFSENRGKAVIASLAGAQRSR